MCEVRRQTKKEGDKENLTFHNRKNDDVKRMDGTPLSHWAVGAVIFLRFFGPNFDGLGDRWRRESQRFVGIQCLCERFVSILRDEEGRGGSDNYLTSPPLSSSLSLAPRAHSHGPIFNEIML